MKLHNIPIWLRIIFCILMPLLYATIQVFYNEKSIIIFLWMLLVAIFAFYLLSTHLVLNEEGLHVKLLFPQDIVLRKIYFKDIVSIDAHKHLFLTNIFIRLNFKTAPKLPLIGSLIGMTENVIGLSPFMNNRRDLIYLILKKNPSVKIDQTTQKYLAKIR